MKPKYPCEPSDLIKINYRCKLFNKPFEFIYSETTIVGLDDILLVLSFEKTDIKVLFKNKIWYKMYTHARDYDTIIKVT